MVNSSRCEPIPAAQSALQDGILQMDLWDREPCGIYPAMDGVLPGRDRPGWKNFLATIMDPEDWTSHPPSFSPSINMW